MVSSTNLVQIFVTLFVFPFLFLEVVELQERLKESERQNAIMAKREERSKWEMEEIKKLEEEIKARKESEKKLETIVGIANSKEYAEPLKVTNNLIFKLTLFK